MARHNAPMTISTALETELERRQVSHKTAGAAIGVSQATFSRWVNGEMRPSPDYRQKLRAWLGMSAGEYDAVWRASANAKPDRKSRQRIDAIEAEIAELRKILLKIAAKVGVDP